MQSVDWFQIRPGHYKVDLHKGAMSLEIKEIEDTKKFEVQINLLGVTARKFFVDSNITDAVKTAEKQAATLVCDLADEMKHLMHSSKAQVWGYQKSTTKCGTPSK